MINTFESLCSSTSTLAKIAAEVVSLNLALSYEKAIFRLSMNVKTDCIDIIPASTVWLHDVGCIINISREFQKHIEHQFYKIGYHVTFNNTASCFWLTAMDKELEDD